MANRVQIRVRNTDKIKANIKAMRGSKIGFPAESTGGQTYPNGTTLAQNAFWQTQGTVNQDGSQRIPPRDFMLLGAFNLKADADRIKDAVLIGVSGQPEKGSLRIGALGVSNMRDAILNGGWTPNDPFTILRKGSSTPLVDTSRLFQGIDSVLK